MGVLLDERVRVLDADLGVRVGLKTWAHILEQDARVTQGLDVHLDEVVAGRVLGVLAVRGKAADKTERGVLNAERSF